MNISERDFLVTDTEYEKDSAIANRSFCARCFTSSDKAPVGRIVEVKSARGAKRFFGVSSDEYKFARKYFSFKSPNGNTPRKLSFARWTPNRTGGWLRGGAACALPVTLRKLKPSESTIVINTTSHSYKVSISQVSGCTSLAGTESTSLVNILSGVLHRAYMPHFLRAATVSVRNGVLQISFGVMDSYSAPFDAYKWVEYGSSTAKSSWSGTAEYSIGDFITYGGNTYVCISPVHIAMDDDGGTGAVIPNNWSDVSFAFKKITSDAPAAFNASVRYSVGDEVTYSSKRMICIAESTKYSNLDDGETILPCTGGELASLLGLTYETGVICSDPNFAESPLQAVRRVTESNDDFGSFMFLDWVGADGASYSLAERYEEVKRIAAWNAEKTFKYMFVEAFPEQMARSVDISNTGTAICLYDEKTVGTRTGGYAFDEFLPMAILASTDFDTEEGATNYMFRTCDEASVRAVAGDSSIWIGDYAKRNLNFYGLVQRVARETAYFMPGKMMDGLDMSVYATEMWLKESIDTWFAKFLINTEIVTPTTEMQRTIASGINDIIRGARTNGMIENSTNLTPSDTLYVSQIFSSEEAPKEIEKDGYCLSVWFDRDSNKLSVRYILMYVRHTQIRKIEGLHYILKS